MNWENLLPNGTLAALKEERRREARFPTDEPASIRLFHPVSGVRKDIHVLEVSKGGMKLRVPNALEPGTVVQIRYKDTFTLAEVRYCLKAGTEFRVGVRLQEVFSKPAP